MKKLILFIILINTKLYSIEDNLGDSDSQIELESFYNSGVINDCYDLNFIKRQRRELENLSKFSLLDLLHDVSSYDNIDPWKDIEANTRISAELCEQEKDFLINRDIITKKQLEHLLSRKLKEGSSLRIALCLSGGGYRALVNSLGYLMGLRFSGLFDAITYITSISGGAWGLASLYGHNLDLVSLVNLLKKQLSKTIYYNFDLKLLIETAIHKLFWGQKINLVGIWGTLIASTLFNDNHLIRFNNYRWLPKTKIPKLSYFQDKIQDSQMPMPIFSAVMVDRGYDWIEFNPYEIGVDSLNTYIPSWSFSREFKGGVSVNSCPEAGLDYLLGIWGSAFTASMRELLEIYEKSIPSFLFQFLDVISIPEGPLANIRISPAIVPNFAYGIAGHPLRNYKDMTLIDGGVNCNLPIAPIFKKNRKVDVVIIIDSSTNSKEGVELKRAERYAETYGITLPKIDYLNIKQVNVFKDFNADIPVIIYMPLIKNTGYSETFDPESCVKESYCSTFNLKYTPEQFDELMGLGQYNFVTSLRPILDAIEALLINRNFMK